MLILALLIQNAKIVDPASRTVTPGDLFVKDGVIEKVPAGYAGPKLDVQGRYVIPGLKDLHVHSHGNSGPNKAYQYLAIEGTAKHMLYAGVTSFLDLFYGAEDAVFSARAKRGPGADIHAAGPIFTCTGGHGTEYGVPTRVINTPAEAEREVTDLAKKKPDVIKLVYDRARKFPSMNKATMEATIRTASRLGFKTVVHIGSWDDAREAVLAGATAITHLYEKPIPDSLVTLMREKKTVVIPTMAVQTDLLQISRNPGLLESPLLKALVPSKLLEAYRDTAKYDAQAKTWIKWQGEGEAEYNRTLKKLADGGVTLVAGSDVGNLGTFQGYSAHRELELMVKAGLSPWQALHAGTVAASEFLGKPANEASFVVLDASPVESIANTQRIHLVFHHGKQVDRAALLSAP